MNFALFLIHIIFNYYRWQHLNHELTWLKRKKVNAVKDKRCLAVTA